MTKRTLHRFSLDEARQRANEAYQVLSILDELAEEMHGLTEYMGLVRDSIKLVYPRHIEAKRTVKELTLEVHALRSRLGDLRKRYSAIITDYEHNFGAIERKKMPSLVNAMVSLDACLAVCPREKVVRGFFDE